MSAGLAADLRELLRNGQFATTKTRDERGHVNGLICPECGKPEAWAYSDKPFAIICNRQNECGARTRTIPLFNVTRQIEARYPPTEVDRHRPARVYLETRGIPAEIVTKVVFEYRADLRGCGGGIMFPLGSDENGKPLYNGRLFNPPKGEGKKHNQGPVSGHFWRMPGAVYDRGQPVYVTEGIIDALSLVAIGQQAIAVIGAGFDPARFDLSEFGELVLAFDRDEAGARFTKRWLDHLGKLGRKVSAIMPEKGDWNDLLVDAGSAEKGAAKFAENFFRYQLQARLMLAESAQEYASTYMEGHFGFAPGLFAFRGCYYWSWVKNDDVLVARASTFLAEVLHFQRADLDEDRPEFSYRLRIKPKDGRIVEATATGNDLKSPDSLRGFFLRHGKALWLGQQDAANAFVERLLKAKAPVVRQADHLGYDHRSGCYVFRDFGIDRAGNVVQPVEYGFVPVGTGEYVRPFGIETIAPGRCDVGKVYDLMSRAWGGNAQVAIAYLAASLFVNQVKPVLKFFPFLSLYGDPQVGKTRLMMTLNAMQCLDEEGIPLTETNTKKGELRAVGQVSGMMKGLLEGNNPAKTRFSFDAVLPLYNHGNSLQTRAGFSNDNRIVKMAFHGSLVFVQNVEPFRERAARERIISLAFRRESITEETKAAFDELVKVPLSELAGFLPAIMAHRVKIEKEWLGRFQMAKKDMGIADNRICENHALILAFHRMVVEFLGIEHDMAQAFYHLRGVAEEKVRSCQVRALGPADYFFEALEQLPDHITGIDQHDGYSEEKAAFVEIKDGKLYVNRAAAEKAIRAYGIPLDYPERLGDDMQRHPAFVGQKSHRFKGLAMQEVRKAYVFDTSRFQG